MNATRVEFYEWLDTLDDENFSKIIELTDYKKSKKEKQLQAWHEFCEIGDSLENPWSSEEEMIEELKEDRRKRAGMSFEEFHKETKELAKSFGIEIE